MKARTRKLALPGARTLYLFLVALVIYAPVAAIVAFSFNASSSGVTWAGFTLDWYGKALSQTTMTRALATSIEVAVMSGALSMLLGATGAVFMVGASNRTKTAVNLLVYAPLVLPEVVLAVSLLMVFSAVGVPYGMFTLVISHTAFCVPYIYILTTIRLKTIDKSLTEAARDLGATPLRAALTITLPLIAPAVVSGGLLAFAMSFDDVAISQFLSGPTSQTFPVFVYSRVKLGITPSVNAISTVIFLILFTAVITTMVAGRKKEKS